MDQQGGRHVCEFRTIELAHVLSRGQEEEGEGIDFRPDRGKEGETVFARLLLVS